MRESTVHMYRVCAVLTRAASIGAALVGSLVLLGWLQDIDALKRVLPGLVSMNPMTAACFVIAGCALWVLRSPVTHFKEATRWRGVARTAAWAIVVVGTLKLAELLLGWNVGIDATLFADRLAGDDAVHPNRMAPNTAFNFVLMGLALAMMDVTTARGRRPTELLSSISFLVSLLALAGYAYRVPEFSGVTSFIPMALHTAATFSLFAIGVFVARPDAGMMKVVTSQSAGGAMARGLFPVMVVAILILGWLRLEGERRGYYGDELGVALYTIAFILVVSLLIWRSAKSLYRAEAERIVLAALQRDSEEQMRLLLDSTAEAIYGIDTHGRCTLVNQACARLLGYASTGELLGKHMHSLIHHSHSDGSPYPVEHCHIYRAVRAQEPVHIEDEVFWRADGTMMPVEYWSYPMHRRGELVGAVITFLDISQRRQAERRILALNATLASKAEELQQTNRELEAFTYTVSHDLRAPLRHVAGYAKMLDEDAGDRLDAELRRYLDAIGSSARHMGTLIDDLLAFSRLGRKPLERLSVDMRELTDSAMRELGGARPASSAVRVAGTLPHALADPVLIKQVWVNLISNALKYSATRGADARVEISGEREGALVRYRIRDNGVGFDMRYVDKLFGVFQRLHAQEEFEGTGVGLAIVERIVTRHGGRIWAEGELDRGATFTFELPVIENQVTEANA